MFSVNGYNEKKMTLNDVTAMRQNIQKNKAELGNRQRQRNEPFTSWAWLVSFLRYTKWRRLRFRLILRMPHTTHFRYVGLLHVHFVFSVRIRLDWKVNIQQNYLVLLISYNQKVFKIAIIFSSKEEYRHLKDRANSIFYWEK